MAKRHMSLDLVTMTTTASATPFFDAVRDRRPSTCDDWADSCESVKRLQFAMMASDGVVAGVNGTVVPPTRKDRRSPTVGCKRPMAIGLPRLNLSLINENCASSNFACLDNISSAEALDRSTAAAAGCCPSAFHPVTPSTPSSCSNDEFAPSLMRSGSQSTLSSCVPTGPASVADQPTNILPFLYLGSQRDALSEEVINANRIKYVINVSTTSPQSPYVSDTNFLRIPVNDSHTDRLLPFFRDAFQFLDAVRESSACVLVHCLAGISRSPTLVIAYIMRHLGMTTDQAYRYVKDRRPSISPNFNFLGQLVEFESQLQRTDDACSIPSSSSCEAVQSVPASSAPPSQSCVLPSTTTSTCSATSASSLSVDECPTRSPSPVKRPCFIDVSHNSPSALTPTQVTCATVASSLGVATSGGCPIRDLPIMSTLFGTAADIGVVQSPTTALSKLNFDLQVAGNGSAAANRGVSGRPRHVKVAAVSSSAGGSVQSACASNVSAVMAASSPRLHSRPVPVAVANASGSADLVGATLGVAPRHENHQLVAWSPSKHSFALLYGRADIEPTSHHPDGHQLLWQQVQQATKSRSFEDILMLSTDANGSGGSSVDLSSTGSSWTTSRGRKSVADHDDDDPGADDRSVPSSLSGHGGSLHGSLEMIQVS